MNIIMQIIEIGLNVVVIFMCMVIFLMIELLVALTDYKAPRIYRYISILSALMTSVFSLIGIFSHDWNLLCLTIFLTVFWITRIFQTSKILQDNLFQTLRQDYDFVIKKLRIAYGHHDKTDQ